jgi:hypothetical protein
MIALSIPEGIPRPTTRALDEGRGMIALSIPEGTRRRPQEPVGGPRDETQRHP